MALESNDGMNGETILSEFMNPKIPSKCSKSVHNGSTKLVSIVDSSKITNLDSDESVESLNIDINKQGVDMVEM